MRRTNSQRFRFAYALSIFIILLNVILISTTVIAQEEKSLWIALWDCEQQTYLDISEGIIFFEGKQYDVEVVIENETGIGTRTDDVTIDLPWASFYIASGEENKWITITTPNFGEYNEFVITVSKEGYNSVEEYVIVSKGDLFISTDRDTVPEDGSFSVTVADQNDEPISGVTLYIEGYEKAFDATNEKGKTVIDAPEVDRDVEINITAIKSGYFPSSDTIHVENVNQPIIDDFISTIFEVSPIAFALFLVIFAMLFVRFRKKTPILLSTSNTDVSQINEKPLRDKKESWSQKNRSYKQTKQINKKMGEEPASTKGSHVEIIRIHSRDDKNKETKNISENKKGLKKALPLNKKNEYEWFNGTDAMKYKIDKLTGNVTEKPADKWFVGEDNIRFKVDKKVVDKKLKKNSNKNAS